MPDDHTVRLLRALPEAAIYILADGRILVANAPAREALGLDSERPVDRNLFERVDAPEDFAATLRAWSRSTVPSPGSFTCTNRSGQTTFNGKGSVIVPPTGGTPATMLVRFWPRAQANPFLLLNQKIAQLNDEVHRRTQVEESLRRSQVALRERAAEAEASNRAKDDFLAILSHELRTPLNAILGWSSLLRGKVADPKVDRAIQVIHRNAEAQAKLIEDILDVSRIVTGKLRLLTNQFDLAALVHDAVEVVRPAAVAKGIELVLAVPNAPCFIVADPDRLRQVAWNVLSNAVKFTGAGGNIHVALERRGSRLSLTVADTGVGIDPTLLPHVFDRFTQADSSTTRLAGGLGLGLALVRHIVELHGGTVAAHSSGTGHGARFTILLPIRAVVVPAPLQQGERAPERARRPSVDVLRGVRILVADDEADARDLLAAVLGEAGAEVETTESADAALAALERFRPHVLVSDIGMPEKDGYWLMREVRRRGGPDAEAIPSVALTAYARPEDRAETATAGFSAHLGKPVDAEELIMAVAHLAKPLADDDAPRTNVAHGSSSPAGLERSPPRRSRRVTRAGNAAR